MADNLSVTEGAGKTIAADEILSVLYQRVKFVIGADGTNDGDVSLANPMPVLLNAAQLITITPPAAITGFATSAKQDTLLTELQLKADLTETQPVSLASVPTHAVTQSGTWTVQPGNTANTTAWKVDGSAVTQPVSGTFWQATQPVSGTVTANMGTVTADPFGANADAASATGSISAKLRFIASTGIPITGTVTVGSHAVTNAGTFVVQENGAALTALQLIDNAVSGAGFNITQMSGVAVSLNTGVRDTGTQRVTIATNDVVPVTFTGSTDVATQTTLASLLTSSQLIDDMIYTDDTSTHATGTSKGALIMGAATPTDTAVNANDIGAIGMTNNREMYVSLRDNNGTATVSGSGTSTGALRVELPTNGTGIVGLAAGTNGIGKLTANSGVTIGAVEIAAAQTLGTVTTVSTVTNVATIGTSVTPGTAAANLGKAEDTVHATGDVGVMALGVGNVAQTTLAADGDYIALAVDTAGNTLVTGNIAHDGVDAGAPIKVGGIAKTAPPTAVAAADRVNAMFDIYGKQIVRGALREDLANQVTTITSSTAETTIVTADATYKLDLYGLTLSNTSATATKVTIKDATVGTTRFILYVPAGDMRGFMLPPDAAHKQAAVNNNWTVTCGTSVATLEITALTVRSL